MERLQQFVELAAGAPPERDARHFRTWQKVSVQAQRAVRCLAAETFFADEARVAAGADRAYTMAVYSACQPCYGRRPMEFTYDAGDLSALPSALRLIGRSLQARLAGISEGFEDARLKRRFLPVWHLDILNAAQKKPRTLVELLAREAAAINALIDLGTLRDERAAKRFRRTCAGSARVLGVESAALEDALLRAGLQNLGDRGTFEDGDMSAPGSPDAGIRAHEDGDDGRAYGSGQMADAGVVADVQAGG